MQNKRFVTKVVNVAWWFPSSPPLPGGAVLVFLCPSTFFNTIFYTSPTYEILLLPDSVFYMLHSRVFV